MLDKLILYFSAYPTVRYAALAILLISACSALLGVSLVLKRYSMIGDGLSHVGFGALAIASAFNLAPLAVTIPVVVALVYSFAFTPLSRHNRYSGIMRKSVAPSNLPFRRSSPS